MELTGKHPIDVALLKQRLQQRRIFQPRFRLPLTYEQTLELLEASIQNEVSFRGKRFVDSKPLRDCMAQVARWCIDPSRFGLMLCGIPGNGKTTVMYAVCQLFRLFEFKNVYGEGAYMQINSAIEVANLAKNNYKAFKSICFTPMLAIDDFGEEPAEVLEYGNVLSPITDLLSIRYKEQLLTILTTNTAGAKVRERYGDRIADRFNEMMKVVIFTNSSYRGQQ